MDDDCRDDRPDRDDAASSISAFLASSSKRSILFCRSKRRSASSSSIFCILLAISKFASTFSFRTEDDLLHEDTDKLDVDEDDGDGGNSSSVGSRLVPFPSFISAIVESIYTSLLGCVLVHELHRGIKASKRDLNKLRLLLLRTPIEN